MSKITPSAKQHVPNCTGDKSVKSGDKVQEILPPVKTGPEAKVPTTNNIAPGKDPNKVVLQTPGQVKSEMGRLYRLVLKGQMNPETGRILIRDHLTPILKATEIEQEYNLANDDPNDDKPAFTGLAISGPEAAPPEGAPARRLDRTDNSTTDTPPETETGEGTDEDHTA